MSNRNNRTYTQADFRQLHAKLPTETYRDNPPDQPPNASDAWLDAHPSGFLLRHNLHKKEPMGKCMLLESLDVNNPHTAQKRKDRNGVELVVNKRLYRYSGKPDLVDDGRGGTRWAPQFRTPAPGEARFARLDDPRVVEVRLPDETYFPELHACAFPSWRRTFDAETRKPDLFSLYFRWFNGGSLSNLMEMYGDAEVGAPVPERFIWRAMENLTRAVIWLQTGLTREDLDGGEEGGARPRAKEGWKPVVHRNILPENIMLHFGRLDREGEVVHGRGFSPRIVLEGFDKANLTEDPEEYWSQNIMAEEGNRKREDYRPGTWEDIYMLGQLLRRLVATHDYPRTHGARPLDLHVDSEAPMAQYLDLPLDDGQEAAYSEDLIKLLMKWEIPDLQTHPSKHFGDDGIWQQIPGIEFLIDEVLPQAAAKVLEYAEKDLAGDADDVSWVMPDPMFETIPFATRVGGGESAVDQLRAQLTRLYGPFIPVWYSYDGVAVSKISAEAVRFYFNRDPDGDDGDGDDDDDDDEEERPLIRSETTTEVEHEESSDQPPPAGGGASKKDKRKPPEHAYIAAIREHQNYHKAKAHQKPVRVWPPKRAAKRRKGRKPAVAKVEADKAALQKDAAEHYGRLMGKHRDDVEQDILARKDDNCGCSNCIRALNKRIIDGVEAGNRLLKTYHDETIGIIRSNDAFADQEIVLPEFEELQDSDFIKEPTNPFNIRSQVELWTHNPFDEAYEEDWRPDRYYPWRKWSYERKKPKPASKVAGAGKKRSSSPSSSDHDSDQDPNPRPSKKPRTGEGNIAATAPAPGPLRRSARFAEGPAPPFPPDPPPKKRSRPAAVNKTDNNPPPPPKPKPKPSGGAAKTKKTGAAPGPAASTVTAVQTVAQISPRQSQTQQEQQQQANTVTPVVTVADIRPVAPRPVPRTHNRDALENDYMDLRAHHRRRQHRATMRRIRELVNQRLSDEELWMESPSESGEE